MNEIINYIKEKQKEYHEGSPAYNVLRALEVELPSLFEPSEHKPPEPEANCPTAEDILKKHTMWSVESVIDAMQEYSLLQRNEAVKSVETLMKASKRGLIDDPKSNYLTNRITILQEILDLLENKPF